MKNSFEEWLHMIQGLTVPSEVYTQVLSKVNTQAPTRLLLKQVRDALHDIRLGDVDATYITDHLQGYHAEPFDFIVNAQIMDTYESLVHTKENINWFPYSFILKKIMEQLGYTHLIENIKFPTERLALFEKKWAE